MVRGKFLSLLAVTVLTLTPLTANATDSPNYKYYDSTKKSYGITQTKIINKEKKDVTSEHYKDGSNSLNLGVNGGDLRLENNSSPSVSLMFEKDKTAVYNVSQNGSIIVNDERFSGQGWSLFLKATPLTEVPLPDVNPKNGWLVADTGKIKYSGIANITQIGSSGIQSSDPTKSSETNALAPTSIEYINPVAIDEQRIRIAYAYKGEGMGSWELNDVLSKVTIEIDDTLKQDKKNYPVGPTPYQTRFEWTLISGPGNN